MCYRNKMCRLNAKAHRADSLGLVHRQEEKVQTLFWLNLGYFGHSVLRMAFLELQKLFCGPDAHLTSGPYNRDLWL